MKLRLLVAIFVVMPFCACSPDYEIVYTARNRMEDSVRLQYTESGNKITAVIPPGNQHEIYRRRRPGYSPDFENDKAFMISAVSISDTLFCSKDLNVKTEWSQNPTSSDIYTFYLDIDTTDF